MMMCRWIVLGMLVLGRGLPVWGQSVAGCGPISLEPGQVAVAPSSEPTGSWGSVPSTSLRSRQVAMPLTTAGWSAPPAGVPSLAPQALVETPRTYAVPAVPVGYQVVRYLPVAESTVVEAPAAVVPSPAPWPVVAPPPSVAPRPVYYLGRGIIGQPKLYVPGQPVRNALRFLTF
jgi:hypothetical protein